MSDWWLKILKKKRQMAAFERRKEWMKEHELRYTCRLCGEDLDDAMPYFIAYCPRCQRKRRGRG
jgi:rubrerythrin